jgi:hypothetical protein
MENCQRGKLFRKPKITPFLWIKNRFVAESAAGVADFLFLGRIKLARETMDRVAAPLHPEVNDDPRCLLPP